MAVKAEKEAKEESKVYTERAKTGENKVGCV